MPSRLQALEPTASYSVIRHTDYAPDGPAVTVTGAELATASVALPHPASSMLLKYTRLH